MPFHGMLKEMAVIPNLLELDEVHGTGLPHSQMHILMRYVRIRLQILSILMLRMVFLASLNTASARIQVRHCARQMDGSSFNSDCL